MARGLRIGQHFCHCRKFYRRIVVYREEFASIDFLRRHTGIRKNKFLLNISAKHLMIKEMQALVCLPISKLNN